MRIDAIHTRVNLILDKAQAGSFSPEEIDDALEVASTKIFNDYLPIYGKDSDSIEALNPFKVFDEFETNEDGEFTVESSERLVAVRLQVMVGEEVKKRDARLVNDDELTDALDSQLCPLDPLFPIVEDRGKKVYKIHPVMETGGEVGYISMPVKPVFGYTIVDDEPVYDNDASTQMLWSNKYIDRIILFAISILGVSLDSAWLRENGLVLEGAMNKKAEK